MPVQKISTLLETRELVAANLQIQDDTLPLFYENPGGSLIFTEAMRFNVVLHDQDVPKFSTEDRSKGTCEELRAATKGALALYDPYMMSTEILPPSTLWVLPSPTGMD